MISMSLKQPEPWTESPAIRLRALLASPRPEYVLEAHNALTALLVEEAGFAGIWASSLTLSCANGVRDHSDLSMTQVLDILESMTERVAIPVLFDGDTGYGDFSHFQRLVRKLCLRSVAGVCIEDKLFPKVNSFLGTQRQVLAPIDEFCGKLRAGKDAQSDKDFVVVARTEALIAGLGLEAALDRAARYAEAGADAVLLHSKAATFAEVAEFMARWRLPVPVVCVPTTYYGTPPEAFAAAGVSLVIWANHMLRAAVSAMRSVAADLCRAGTARVVEDRVERVQELFRLQGEDLGQRAEEIYQPHSRSRAILLAASRGDGLEPLTRDRPKCMIPIRGEPLIHKLFAQLRAEGVRDLVVVRGYAKEALAAEGVSFRDKDDWESSGELGSLAAARESLEGDVVVAYGDILFKRYILHELLESSAPLTLVVDAAKAFLASGHQADKVRVSRPASLHFDEEEEWLVDIGPHIPDGEADGEWIGLLYARTAGTRLLRGALDALLATEAGDTLGLEDLLRHLVLQEKARIRVLYIHGDWLDIDGLVDLGREDIP